MSTRFLRPAALSLAALFVVIACGSDDAASPTPDPEAAAQPNPIAQSVTATAQALPCSDSGQPLVHPDWPVGGSSDPQILPIIMSSLVTVGPTRFLFNVTDANYRVISSPDVQTEVSFYAIERDAKAPVSTVPGAYLDTQIGRGLYRATADLDCAGEWGAEISVRLQDGSTASERLRFAVHPVGTTPAIGAAAPRSESLTATAPADVRLISTDPNPFPGAYERTVAEVVTAGQPSLVFFATPAFCQTGFCGPTVNLVKSVAIDYEDEIGYVNVEPYEMHMTENGLQPMLDEDGQLKLVQAVLDYGIPVEPYLFLVDADGNVFAKFEGVVGADELRGAIEDSLGQSA
jgi:hypothetical protein